MTGRRVPNETAPYEYVPGDYGFYKGQWWCIPPGDHTVNLLGNLKNHTVTEHEDGTITVSPSIQIMAGSHRAEREVWHGFLEKGVWRTV